MDIHELEDTLARLPSVAAVRITGSGSDLGGIHVLASPERAPKQVIRDIQTLALARFGVDVDRDIVSIVQIGPGAVASDEDRPAILGVHEMPEGPRTTVTVTLGWHGEEYLGTASGPAGQSAHPITS